VTDTKPNYATWQAIKKHIIESISISKGRKFGTIEIWFNANVVKALKELGYVLPKAESKNAESMSKLRAELSSIEDDDLVLQIAELAKAGDKASLKKAAQLASEKEKRTKQALTEVKKSESKASSELKTMLKKWLSGMTPSELATLVYVKNNFNDISKIAKVTK
jgi:hypothetical protein